MHDLGEDFPRIFHARGGEPLSSPDFFLSTIHSSDDFRFPRGLRNHHRARHPLPKDGEFERGVFNRRSTATVESRSRREPPNNWHTLPRDWQLPPVPPRSCNPRHARIHGLRRRTGNRRGRSSDASCPSSTATPIPCAPSSIRVLAEACESSSLSLILSSPKLFFDTFRYFRLFEFRFRPSKTSGRWLPSFSPQTLLLPLLEIREQFHYLKEKIQSQ